MDSYRLSLGGTTLDIGSYVLAEQPPDFDFGGLFQANYAQNAYADGGVLAYETNALRKFQFRLRLASSAAFTGGLDGLEQLVRALARPRAVIDLQPEGVASALSVRFDVADGRLDPAYSIYLQRVARREAVLQLTVQPFGYMPTQILLASTASMAIPGRLLIPIGSMLGDVPGLGRLAFSPTVASQFAGTGLPDTIAWSLGGNPSHFAVIQAGSIYGPSFAPITLSFAAPTGNPFARASQMFGAVIATSGPFQQIGRVTIPASLEPAWRGRFRAYAVAQVGGASQLNSYHLSLDAVPLAMAPNAAMATSQPLASILSPNAIFSATQLFQFLDLGEISLPPAGASGVNLDVALRLWARSATSASPMAAAINISELYMLPLDISGAGVLPRGLSQPTITAVASSSYLPGVLSLDSITGRAIIGQATGDIGSVAPLADARIWYRGVMPALNGSAQALDLVGAINLGLPATVFPPHMQGKMFAAASISYRPRFTFMRSL